MPCLTIRKAQGWGGGGISSVAVEQRRNVIDGGARGGRAMAEGVVEGGEDFREKASRGFAIVLPAGVGGDGGGCCSHDGAGGERSQVGGVAVGDDDDDGLVISHPGGGGLLEYEGGRRTSTRLGVKLGPRSR